MVDLKDQFDILLQKGGTGLRDFISSLIQSLQFNSDQLDPFYENLLKRSKYNGQKMVLQKALNEIFATGGGAHEIIVQTILDPTTYLYFYEPSETVFEYFFEPSESDPIFFFEPSETPSPYDFEVKIPVADWTAELQRRVTSETELIKIVGKTFTVITY